MVRRAVKEDINRINELGKLVNANFDKLFDMELILSENISKVFVYELNQEVMGFLHVTELYETVDIINIAVDELHRYENIGITLMDYMISDAGEGVQVFTLEVAVDNDPAINLYKKFGFEVVNTRKSYYEGKDAYLMGKTV